jgi:histidinol phosphatase-like enzyme
MRRDQSPGPLPHTARAPRALFVDRWGTLLAHAPGDLGRALAPESYTRGALAGLFRAVQGGFLVYLLGNEELVAQGRRSEADYREFEAALLAHLAGQGVPVRRSYACLDHPNGRGKHKRDSVFRLPNTGAFYHAAQEDGIELGRSWVVGDGSLELAAGWRAGCHLARVGDTRAKAGAELAVEPELRAADLGAALAEILAAEGVRRRGDAAPLRAARR